MRVGRIVAVEDFPEARRPAWKLRIDFGPEIGEKRSSAQITNYAREELEGRLVVGVVNFPPRQIGPVRSEVLVLGAVSDGHPVLLLEPDEGIVSPATGSPRARGRRLGRRRVAPCRPARARAREPRRAPGPRGRAAPRPARAPGRR